ncbi:hypothetical protein [Nocardia brasiliensis]|uniref:hypothetical protein n=1 Tax=Nocardia brasiliensis TaxID=37326 RepID=UPI00245657BC|nr:hypothetical protein [Nocardia brasiliensis]
MKPEVRLRTTFTVGDSIIQKPHTVPSPLTDPREWSYCVNPNDRAFAGLDRNYYDHPFRSRSFVEAQIHGDVTVDDIEYVALHEEPGERLTTALERSGVEWTVLNNDVISQHGSVTQRAEALERAEQDLQLLEQGPYRDNEDFQMLELLVRRDVQLLRNSLLD